MRSLEQEYILLVSELMELAYRVTLEEKVYVNLSFKGNFSLVHIEVKKEGDYPYYHDDSVVYIPSLRVGIKEGEEGIRKLEKACNILESLLEY